MFEGEEKEGYVKSKETRVLSTFSYLVDLSRATTRRIGAEVPVNLVDKNFLSC